MRRGLVAANWKMHGLGRQVDSLLGQLVEALGDEQRYDIVICPPSVYLERAQQRLAGSSLRLGAQNIYIHDEGAYTGEISARMLTDFDCGYVIVGHSERRDIFAESDELVAEKFSAAQRQGLTPILCLGESREQREAGRTEAVVMGQLDAVLDRHGIEAFRQSVIAYEPVWAIGTGLSASPVQAQEMHELIRRALAQRDKTVAQELRILYGGSVKADNAVELFTMADIDGALVGGASLDAGQFSAICRAMA